jgi:hypothetical protein
MRRWLDKGIVHDHFVEWHGEAVQSVKTAFKTAVRLARLSGNLTPHTLRHTAATWLMQAGVDKWEAAGFLGMSVEMLDQVYGHHHPDYLGNAAQALSYGRRRQSLAETLAGDRTRRPLASQLTEKIGGARSPYRTRLQPTNSLLTGKRTGNFGESACRVRF